MSGTVTISRTSADTLLLCAQLSSDMMKDGGAFQSAELLDLAIAETIAAMQGPAQNESDELLSQISEQSRGCLVGDNDE